MQQSENSEMQTAILLGYSLAIVEPHCANVYRCGWCGRPRAT
jgi:hypothetical protein